MAVNGLLFLFGKTELAEVGTPAAFLLAQAMTHWKCREFCVVMKRLFVNQTMA